MQKTPNLNLTQYEENDRIGFTTNYNDDMLSIDNGYGDIKSDTVNALEEVQTAIDTSRETLDIASEMIVEVEKFNDRLLKAEQDASASIVLANDALEVAADAEAVGNNALDTVGTFNDRINTVEASTVVITSDVAKLKTQVDELKETTDTQGTELDGQMAILDTAVDDISTLSADMEAAKSSILNLTAKDTELEAHITSDSDRITALENAQSGTSNDVSSLTSDLSVLEGNVTTLTEKVNLNSANIEDAENAINALEGRMAESENDITENNTLINNLTQRLDSLTTQVSLNVDDIGNLDMRITATENQITNVEDQITSLTPLRELGVIDSTNKRYTTDFSTTITQDDIINVYMSKYGLTPLDIIINDRSVTVQFDDGNFDATARCLIEVIKSNLV